jgi:hypothetical protein
VDVMIDEALRRIEAARQLTVRIREMWVRHGEEPPTGVRSNIGRAVTLG